MFRVKVLVDDKKLAQVMWALDGLVLGSPEITPLKVEEKAAETSQPERIVQVKGSGLNGKTIIAGVIDCLAIGSEYTSNELHALWVQNGGKETHKSVIAQRLKLAGAIKTLEPGRYKATGKPYKGGKKRPECWGGIMKGVIARIAGWERVSAATLKELYVECGGSANVNSSTVAYQLKQAGATVDLYPGWYTVVKREQPPAPATPVSPTQELVVYADGTQHMEQS